MDILLILLNMNFLVLSCTPCTHTHTHTHIKFTHTHTVSNDQLRGTCDYSRAQVLQFVNMADNEVLPSVCTWVFPTLGIMQYNANVS